MEENVERITHKIIEDAEKRSDEIIDGARKEAQEKIDAANRRGGQIRDRIIAEAEKNALQTKRKIIAESKIKARTIILESKEKVLQETFMKAKNQLDNFKGTKDYEKTLLELAKDTCIQMGGGALKILVRKEDETGISKGIKNIEKEVTNATGQKTSLELGADEMSSGVVVLSADGRVQIDSTFDNRLELLKPSLRLKVAEVLFP